MKAVLRDFCSSIQIDVMGIAPRGPYLELAKILQERRALGYYTEFEEADLAKRIDPSLIMADVQSIIVCIFPYLVPEQTDANIAKYGHGIDYHIVVKDKLEQVGLFLTSQIAGFQYQAFTDTGPLVDRYLAYLAGVGFYGQNNNIITEKYGSYVVIGYMLTNYLFENDEPLLKECANCGQCKATCPGQAILEDFVIDAKRCRSYLTQKKGELTATEISVIKQNKVVFGCDVCQDVCPHNLDKQFTQLSEFKENIISNLDYDELVGMSNKEFIRRYGKRAFSWRGRKLIVRNFEYLL